MLKRVVIKVDSDVATIEQIRDLLGQTSASIISAGKLAGHSEERIRHTLEYVFLSVLHTMLGGPQTRLFEKYMKERVRVYCDGMDIGNSGGFHVKL